MRISLAHPFAILGLLAALPALGQAPAFLVRDINPDQPAPVVIEGGVESEVVGSLFYFVANDGTHGGEVWRTDGTPAGALLLKDICPGACSSIPRDLTGSNGLLFFFVDDPEKGPCLWKSDGTPEGTSLVKGGLDGRQGLGGFIGPSMVDAGGQLLFTVMNSGGLVDLWVTDGTQAGTHGVGSNAQGFYSIPRFLATGNGKVLFAADKSPEGLRLEPWVTDGTNAGTHAVADLNPGAGNSLAYFNNGPGKDAVAAPWGGFVFVAEDISHGPELWRTDGTEAGTSQLKDIAPGSAGSSPFNLTVLNGKVIFGATDPTHGSELWATDGTPAGTVLLKDIWPGGSNSDPRALTAVGSQVFFHASDGIHGDELWATDGTAGGTRLVKDLAPGPTSDFPFPDGQYMFAALGGHLVFYTPQDNGGFQTFWTSDGTEAGTQPFSPASGVWPYVDYSAGTDNHGVVGGRLFFRGTFFQGEFAPSIWVTDGTPAGSSKTVDIPVSTSSFDVSIGTMEPNLLADLDGTLLFQATDGSHYALWRSDGTEAGTSLVKDLTEGAMGSLPNQLHAVNGRMAFSNLGQLGLSDGTPAGTAIVLDGSGLAFANKPLGNELFFFSQAVSDPLGLWKTDGTEAGTTLVNSHNPGTFGSELVPSGGKLFYSFFNGASYDLWVSDGTAAGTSILGSGVSPGALTDAGGTLFFYAFQPSLLRYTLWKSDGTAAGTVQVHPVTVTRGPFAALPGGTVLFLADDGAHGEELWRSDGTGAGTVLVKDIAPGLTSSRISGLAVAGNQAFFAASDGVHGLELWASDGTAAGTHLAKDIVPGAGSSAPYSLKAAGSVAVFSAFDEANGVEAWRSDGTDAGTWRLADIAPGALSSSPLGYTLSGNKLFLTADDNTAGFELWAIPKIWVTGTFADVPPNYWAWRFVESLAASGVTGGCGNGNFCPGDLVNRAQMAVFLLAARDGAPPPPATGTRFGDVPAGYWAGPWIEELASEGVVSGCSAMPPLYCPDNHLTRAEMAVLLTSARHETPPPATGTRFADVPADYWAAPWIEQLAADGITGGCGGGNYCPDQPVTRAEMAVFLATAFHLPLP